MNILDAAILKSTTKWIEISHDLKEDLGRQDCGLCQLNNYDDCDGCVINEDGCHETCDDTPHEKWWRHQQYNHHRQFLIDEYRVDECMICKQIALEEALFIYGLM